MTKTQKEYVANRLSIFGTFIFLTLSIVGIVFDSLIINIIVSCLCAFFILYLVTYWIAQIVYRWRVMGATNDEEHELFSEYWTWTIRTGTIDEEIESIEEKNWSDETKAFVRNYLVKIKNIKIPKILTF